MTRSQKLILELDEKKTKLAKLLDSNEGTAAEIKALGDRIEALTNGGLIAAAQRLEQGEADGAVENGYDGETLELQALMGRPVVGEIIAAASKGQAPQGAAREAQQAVNASENEIPWGALLPESFRAADAATSGPATTPIRQNPIIARLFSRTAAAFLGVMFPSVPVGQASYVALATGPDAAPKAKGAAVDAAAATWGVKTMSPTRLTARYLYRQEDALLTEGLEQALRMDLAGTLGEQLDAQVLAGDGVAPNVAGFFDADSGLTVPADAGAEATVSDYINVLTDVVDGKVAGMESEVRILLGSATFKHAGRKFIDNTDKSALMHLREMARGVQVSSFVPAVASKNQLVLTASPERNAGYAVAPMWGAGPQVIRDNITGAASGEVALTILSFFNFAIVRTDGYKLHKRQVAA